MEHKSYVCKRCNAIYRYKSGLSRHTTVAHYNLKYHKCTNCDYRSYDNAAVKRHKRWCKQEIEQPIIIEDDMHIADATPYEEFDIDVGGADITVAEYVEMDPAMSEKFGISGVLVVQKQLDTIEIN